MVLLTQTCLSPILSKWTEWIEVDQIGLKWIKLAELGWNGLNVLKRTELD